MASLSPPLLVSPNLRLIRRSPVSVSASCNPNCSNPSQKKKRVEDGDGSPVPEDEMEKGVDVMTRRGRSEPALITAEKAKVMRREMRLTETWRDAMYHSAIASRLASPDDDQ